MPLMYESGSLEVDRFYLQHLFLGDSPDKMREIKKFIPLFSEIQLPLNIFVINLDSIPSFFSSEDGTLSLSSKRIHKKTFQSHQKNLFPRDSLTVFCYSKNEICYSKNEFLLQQKRIFAIARNFCYSKKYDLLQQKTVMCEISFRE